MFQSAKRLLARAASTVSPRAWLRFEILRRSHHFEPEFWLLPDLCRGGVALDVGGNAGQFAYQMARTARTVHVFEPNPACLTDIIRVRTSNMLLHPYGLSDRDGEAHLRVDPNNTGIGTVEEANSLTNNPGIGSLTTFEVSVRRLDSLGLGRVDFAKIDVEGHEPAVVRGALETIAAHRPTLLIEIELRHNPTSFFDIEAMLSPLGYGCFYLRDGILAPTRAGDQARLQSGQPGGPDYVNNFIFKPRR